MLTYPEPRQLTEEQFSNLIDEKGLTDLEKHALRQTIGLSYDSDITGPHLKFSLRTQVLMAWQKIRGNSLLGSH